MKNIFKKLLVVCAVILAASFTTSLATPQTASAATDRTFLGLVPWDQNTGFFKADGTPNKLTEDKIKSGVWVAVANVITDITVIAAYLVLGYVIYGGYLYIFSGGDPGKVAAGKKTLTQAFIGLAIVMLATVIMNSIRIALGANFAKDCATSSCINPASMVNSAITWTIGMGAIVSAIFVVYGGIAYTTSAGDPGKVEKAKKTILYALIGLIVCALAEVITLFATKTITDAKSFNPTHETIISKEVHEQIT